MHKESQVTTKEHIFPVDIRKVAGKYGIKIAVKRLAYKASVYLQLVTRSAQLTPLASPLELEKIKNWFDWRATSKCTQSIERVNKNSFKKEIKLPLTLSDEIRPKIEHKYYFMARKIEWKAHKMYWSTCLGSLCDFLMFIECYRNRGNVTTLTKSLTSSWTHFRPQIDWSRNSWLIEWESSELFHR